MDRSVLQNVIWRVSRGDFRDHRHSCRENWNSPWRAAVSGKKDWREDLADKSMTIWLEFLFCVGVIGVAGVRLIRYGDALAELTGLSRNWIGLILVATVTSLPELVTGLSAVTVAEAPDIAVGDSLGSCVFNLTILALIDGLYRRAPLYASAGRTHRLTAALGALLLLVAVAAIAIDSNGAMPSIGHVSVASLVILAVYLAAMRRLYQREQRTAAVATGRLDMNIKAALTGYAVASAVIVGAGIWLPLIGVELARVMGWSNSFVGTLFVAFATSVPELATTWGAMRIGALDMAFGNLLGSNLFDVLILAFDDMAYLPGPIFRQVSSAHAMTAMIAALMSGVVIVALTVRPQQRVLRTTSWAGVALLALYLLNAGIQYVR